MLVIGGLGFGGVFCTGCHVSVAVCRHGNPNVQARHVAFEIDVQIIGVYYALVSRFLFLTGVASVPA